MIPSPRALLGVAPAVLVFVGSYFMSRSGDWSDRSVEAEPAAEAFSVHMVDLGPADEDRLHRVALKEETVTDLLEGRLTLAAAVDRFEYLGAPPEAAGAGESTPHARALSQVMSYVHHRSPEDLARLADRLAALQSEARALEVTN